jgi:hypothetical protein
MVSAPELQGCERRGGRASRGGEEQEEAGCGRNGAPQRRQTKIANACSRSLSSGTNIVEEGEVVEARPHAAIRAEKGGGKAHTPVPVTSIQGPYYKF